MTLNRICTIESVPAATATASTTDRETRSGGRRDIEADGRYRGSQTFGWGVRNADGNYAPATYGDFRQATVLAVSYESRITGSRVVFPIAGDVVNLIHPSQNRIVLQWTAGRVVYDTDPFFGFVGFPVTLVADSYDSQYADVAVGARLRMGTGMTQITPGPRVTRKVWARIRDSISSAGVVIDQGETQEARIEEATAIVRFYPAGAVGLSLTDDLGRDWDITGSQVTEDRTAIIHNLERRVVLEEAS